MLRFAVIFSLIFSLPVLAKKIELTKLTNDMDKELVSFFIHLDQNNNVDSMSYVTKDEDGRIVKEMDWSYGEVSNGGAILDVRNGYDVLRMELNPKFDPSHGGEISLIYLYNGVTNTVRRMNLTLEKVKSSFVLKHTGKKITNLYVRGNRIRIVGLVGIRTIDVTYAK